MLHHQWSVHLGGNEILVFIKNMDLFLHAIAYAVRQQEEFSSLLLLGKQIGTLVPGVLLRHGTSFRCLEVFWLKNLQNF